MQSTIEKPIDNVRSIAEILPEILKRYDLDESPTETYLDQVIALPAVATSQPVICEAS